MKFDPRPANVPPDCNHSARDTTNGKAEKLPFHWWDHVHGAPSSLQVESDQNGIKLKKTMEEDEEDGMISNKKPRKATLAKAKLYGCFVKSATLLSGQEQPEPKSSNSDNSSSSDEEEDDQKLDLSSTTKLSDADLVKACGGRTAHKGARHGLTMSAKLARLEQQEAEFMAKYGKKSQPVSASLACVTPADQRAESQEEDTRKKTKKKKSTGRINELNGNEVSETPETDVKPKKKKKEKKAVEKAEEITDAVSTEDLMCVENSEADHSHKTKRKHKKNNNTEWKEEDRAPSTATESKSLEETAELHTDIEVKKKKKKKKTKKSSKHHSVEEESNETESSQSELVHDGAPKTKKRKATVLLEEAEVTEETSVNIDTIKQKRKKCKKEKTFIDDKVYNEVLPPKKKKKKYSI
ncbi:G patch domain-containing protein 4 [Lates japonicus]|uniref:G patch domain-containing protein 4 n=1 Tax=Lates japonicus TaxID=270547 RepID=A0AAD3M2X1_LATJO|nr:G patch domain-containing protein 4 [Lates japonicus]